MSIQENKDKIVEEFLMFDEWLDRYQYLIDLGKTLEPLEESKKTDANLIKGCQSRVWLDYRLDGETIYFSADSDALITKGIIALLINVYSGQKAQDIANDNFDFLQTIGLRDNLSPTRANGLVSMIETIRLKAQENK